MRDLNSLLVNFDNILYFYFFNLKYKYPINVATPDKYPINVATPDNYDIIIIIIGYSGGLDEKKFYYKQNSAGCMYETMMIVIPKSIQRRAIGILIKGSICNNIVAAFYTENIICARFQFT